jgi:hypothetical protein
MPAVSKQLLSMLDGLRMERAQLTERLKVLSEREKTIRGWLAEERAEQERLDKVPSEFPPAAGTPLSVALRAALADGKAKKLQELVEFAEVRHLLPETGSPGRQVHFALVGMQKHGYVERQDDDTLRLRK